MDFYKELFGEQKCDVSSMDFLFKDLPKLNTEQQKELDSFGRYMNCQKQFSNFMLLKPLVLMDFRQNFINIFGK